ncbi:MAG: coiled-coil domain-containing protein, partial [Deltaproteobacteria bacterium]
ASSGSDAPLGERRVHPAIVGRALDLATVAEAHVGLVRGLLGDALIVRDLASALELRDQGAQETLVTLAGELLWADGALSGGTADGRGAGELQQRREIAELTGVVHGLEVRQVELSSDERRLGALSAQLEGDLKALANDAHAEALSFAHRERDLGAAVEDIGRSTARLSKLDLERASLEAQLAELTSEEVEARREQEGAQAQREEREAELAAAKAELARVGTEREIALRSLTELRVQIAAGRERREALERRLGELTRALEEGGRRGEVLVGELARMDQRIVDLSAELSAAQESLGVLNQKALALLEEREGLSARRAEAQGRVVQLEGALRDERRHLEGCRASLAEAQLDLREKGLELSHLAASLVERHDAGMDEAVSRFHLLPHPGPEAEGRLAELRQTLSRLGEVNLTAIEEHREVTERYDFLSGQKLDLEQSLSRLREAIARMNRTSRERFRETFDLVNQRFSEVFPRLFAGGKACLVLGEDSEDLLEAGLEIVAQPPGKRLQNVNLLSGGEKALTAVALIFAIFLIKPTPFCLLDEVDAPLDEGNVGRYNGIVREMSRLSQFILITHNKRTMEIADTLYGVTMEDPGCSKLVSVRFSDRREATVAA